jgi:diadenosine tetraphosphate (Ap4A) HIT family hydrolase
VSENWMPREEWDKLASGDNPLVRYANAPFDDVMITEYGYTVADLERSRLQLCRNQYVKGYCILVAKKAVREVHEMHEHERRLFFEDMVAVGAALEKVFQPIKLNYQILGNNIPHLHVHIIPRYYGDPAPSQPIRPNTEQVTFDNETYASMVGDIREALGFTREIISDPLLINFLDKQGRVKDWPSRKHLVSQPAVLVYLAEKFEPNRSYTEKEVNAILNQWATFGDWALLRRELFENGYLNRKKDGSAYWVELHKED